MTYSNHKGDEARTDDTVIMHTFFVILVHVVAKERAG
jgi:hypothetical protein